VIQQRRTADLRFHPVGTPADAGEFDLPQSKLALLYQQSSASDQ